jgi:hypothetical protein
MGNSQSITKINFEDMQYAIEKNYTIINTIDDKIQTCLIKNTLNINQEISLFNNKNINKNMEIIIYGLNSCDNSVLEKYNQLKGLAFTNLFIYTGGLFEWLLLQDIYGDELFPTTEKEIDILKYKGNKKLNILLLK